MTAQQQGESTRYEVPQDWSLPDLAEVMRTDVTEAAPTVEHSTTEYFDTGNRDLLNFGATLLRRSGTVDEGWELTLPEDFDPAAHRAPLGPDTAVPDALAALVTGIARGNPLTILATARCESTRHRWVDDAGTVVVTISDEILHATSSAPGAARLDSWRELLVEPGPGSRRKLQRRLEKSLPAGGAEPVEVGNRLPRTSAPNTVTTPKAKSGRKSTGPAADAIAFLAAQDAALIVADVCLRTGEEDVHAVRVATRRARSALKVFEALFDPAAVTQLSGELAWYAALLGEIRDRQVQRERFATALAQLPDELVLGPVAATIEHHLLGEQLRARTTLREAMAGDRYHALLRTSAEFVRHPPLAPSTTRSTKRAEVTSAAVERADRKARRRLDLALATGTDQLLHEARKAAKRARYVAELGSGRGGKHRKAVKAFRQLQDILGEFQDSVVAAELLRRLGSAIHADPAQNGFTFGILHEQEIRGAAQARAAARRWRRHH